MEVRFFEEGTIPEWTTPEWYAGRDTAPHLEQEGHRERLLLTANMVEDALRRGAKDIVDVGSGDGGLLSLFKGNPDVYRLLGFDLQQTNVDAARDIRGVQVDLLDVINEESWTSNVNPSTVLVATEMLEHLIFPHEFVAKLHSTGAQYLVASSPHTESWESRYEFHTWAWDLEGYKAMLENNGWSVIRQETTWISQVLLAVRK